MADWSDVNGLDLPVGMAGAQPYGYDELGRPTYRGADGTIYTLQDRDASRPARTGGLIEGIGNALRGLWDGAVQGVTAPARAARGESTTLGDAWATGGMAATGGVGATAAAPIPEGALAANSFRAYHGSPHQFDRFSMDAIGTGEGAQAYGHGLYFADAEDTARAYRDALRFPRIDSPKTIAEQITDDLNYHRGDVEGLRREYQFMVDSGNPRSVEMGRAKLDALDGVVAANPGHMYEVQINADPDTFLDWDAPLSQQPEAVQRALMNHPNAHRFNPEWTGAQLYESTLIDPGEFRSPPAATEALRGSGVNGIRYNDAGSRGTDSYGATRNTVVFDDSLVEILRRYGIAGVAPGAAATFGALAQQFSQQGQPTEADMNALRGYLGGT